VQVYDPLAGDTPVKSFSNISSLNLDVVDHPIIINIAAGSGARPEPNHFYGGTGIDTFTVTSPTDIVDESRGGGTDTVMSSITFSLADRVHAIGPIEKLTLTGNAPINATGNGLNNVLVGNTANNVLDGGTGIDHMQGGAGDDTYIVDNTNDIVIEAGGSGNDTVKSYVTLSLADKNHVTGTVENLTLLGTANTNATGNSAGNIITGNSGNNILTGGDGNDQLVGGNGNDILNGGAGADHFVFDFKPSAYNIDKVEDFSESAGDKIVLDHNVFTAIDPANFFAGNLVVGTKALDTNDRLVYDQPTGKLFYDADGNGQDAAIQIATLSNLTTLHYDDFLFL